MIKKVFWEISFAYYMIIFSKCSPFTALKAANKCSVMFGHPYWKTVSPKFAGEVEGCLYNGKN
jgi:hypothetical protein